LHVEIPDDRHASHGCLLISETSCEQHNLFLDRSLALETVGYSGSEFFRIHDLPLHSLTDGSLRAVAASLRSGVLAAGMSRSEIQRTCGSASVAVCEYFNTLYSDGFSPKHILAIRSQDLCGVAGSRISARASPSAPTNRSAQRRELGAAFDRPRHWESPAMADRNLSRREPRSASGLS
jgi:hypothetical protein